MLFFSDGVLEGFDTLGGVRGDRKGTDVKEHIKEKQRKGAYEVWEGRKAV